MGVEAEVCLETSRNPQVLKVTTRTFRCTSFSAHHLFRKGSGAEVWDERAGRRARGHTRKKLGLKVVAHILVLIP